MCHCYLKKGMSSHGLLRDQAVPSKSTAELSEAALASRWGPPGHSQHHLQEKKKLDLLKLVCTNLLKSIYS